MRVDPLDPILVRIALLRILAENVLRRMIIALHLSLRSLHLFLLLVLPIRARRSGLARRSRHSKHGQFSRILQIALLPLALFQINLLVIVIPIDDDILSGSDSLNPRHPTRLITSHTRLRERPRDGLNARMDSTTEREEADREAMDEDRGEDDKVGDRLNRERENVELRLRWVVRRRQFRGGEG